MQRRPERVRPSSYEMQELHELRAQVAEMHQHMAGTPSEGSTFELGAIKRDVQMLRSAMMQPMVQPMAQPMMQSVQVPPSMMVAADWSGPIGGGSPHEVEARARRQTEERMQLEFERRLAKEKEEWANQLKPQLEAPGDILRVAGDRAQQKQSEEHLARVSTGEAEARARQEELATAQQRMQEEHERMRQRMEEENARARAEAEAYQKQVEERARAEADARIQAAESRAEQDKVLAEERARQAEERAQQEQLQAAQRAREAEEAARLVQQQAEERTREAEERARDAEQRAQQEQMQAEAKDAEERTRAAEQRAAQEQQRAEAQARQEQVHAEAKAAEERTRAAEQRATQEQQRAEEQARLAEQHEKQQAEERAKAERLQVEQREQEVEKQSKRQELKAEMVQAAPSAPSAQMAGVASKRCSALDAMAAQLGVRAPSAGAWSDMFGELAEALPHAIAITDMKVPGLPVKMCNGAMVKLTGYPKSHTEGRNCRFLQGKRTEAAAVRTMVSSIRGAKATTVRVTNYRKGGTAFTNVLTLHPVYDSEGEYRFNIGVLSDGALAKEEGEALQKLRAALPSQFDATLQPKVVYETATKVDQDAQLKQYRASMVKFTRLLWSIEWDTSLRHVVTHPAAVTSFGKWLTKEAPSDAMQLELVVLTGQLASMPAEQAGQQAMALCERYLGEAQGSGDTAIEALRSQADQALTALASESFPKFVQSKACLPLVEELLGKPESLKKADQLLWSKYTVPEDCSGWIHSFVSVAETYPACIVISDMAMPGNPMFFVNQEFCRITGYAKHEASGRNCRFLQGPKTEPQSVAVIQDTLRRGVDCHVKITNYRKSGDLFENLLTMRPVHDSNGVYRFCIGVQFEVTRDMSLKNRLAKLDKLIKLLPSTLEVASKAVGAAHDKQEAEVEQTTELADKLSSALSGATVGPEIEGVLGDPEEYKDYHKEMLAHVAGGDPATTGGVVPRGQ